MKECGYKITRDIIADNVESRFDSRSSINLNIDSDSLAAYYLKVGLTIKRQRPEEDGDLGGTGGTSPVACRICGPLKDQPWYKKDVSYLACDAEKHAAFYDAFNGGN